MPVQFPPGFVLEDLKKSHPRAAFVCGAEEVDNWLHRHALQSQNKQLSKTRVVVAGMKSAIAGYYTLAMGSVALDELPQEVARNLPNRLVPAVTLAWLGVDRRYQDQKLGARILAAALEHCCNIRRTIPFTAVIIDCLDENAKSFYARYDFIQEVPGHPMKLVVPNSLLDFFAEDDIAQR